MRSLRIIVTLSSVTLSGLLACGSQVTFTNGAAATTGSSSSSSGTSSPPSTVEPPTTTNTSTPTTPGGQCGRTNDTFQMMLFSPEKMVWSCQAFEETQQGAHSFNAQVTQSSEGHLLLDACPPNADCLPMTYELHFGAPYLYNVVPLNAFVRVSVAVGIPWGCEHALSIVNIPEWGGVKNPVTPAPILWLAGADGTYAAAPNSPFSVDAEALNCYPNEQPGCGPKEDFVLWFKSEYSSEALNVPMGETREWIQAGYGGSHVLTVHNLRSYETGWCDDYWNWGYYIYGSEMLD